MSATVSKGKPDDQKIPFEIPTRQGVDIKLSPEVERRNAENRQIHTYTIDYLRKQRHTRELSNPVMFQFLAEVQLYRRFLSGGRRGRVQMVPVDMAVLQHRIGAILYNLNVDTLGSVFTDILGLGIDSADFVVSYVNVVFKQAVLNPQLATLYALLTEKIVYIAKRIRIGEKMGTLLVERCNEAFVVPMADTDTGVVALLRGIVAFGGQMMRNGLLPESMMKQWAESLVQSQAGAALELLIDLIHSGGVVLAGENAAVLEQLAEKMKETTDAVVLHKYAKLMELVKTAVTPLEQSDNEMKQPEMKRSPSMDKALDGKYPSLFKKSDSIPMELSQLAGNDDDEESMNGVVGQYLYNLDFAEFTQAIERLGYAKGQDKIPNDLLNVILDEADATHSATKSSLFVQMLQNDFYSVEQLKNAVKNVADGVGTNNVVGQRLAAVFARLLNNEIVEYDDFESLFAGMRSLWPTAVHTILTELNTLRGSLDDMLESEYWKNVGFLGVEPVTDKIAKLKEWDVISFLPHYEIASIFMQNAQSGSVNVADVNSEDADIRDVAPIIFELLCTFDDALMRTAAEKLKPWFQSCLDVIPDVAAKCGAPGASLMALFQ